MANDLIDEKPGKQTSLSNKFAEMVKRPVSDAGFLSISVEVNGSVYNVSGIPQTVRCIRATTDGGIMDVDTGRIYSGTMLKESEQWADEAALKAANRKIGEYEKQRQGYWQRKQREHEADGRKDDQ